VIVVDASVLASIILLEPGWENLVPHIINCFTVDHAIKEVFNAIWKASYKGLITIEDAIEKARLFIELVGTNIRLVDEQELIRDALTISLDKKITVYDALYIALALREQLPLLTLDKTQRDVAKQLGVRIISP